MWIPLVFYPQHFGCPMEHALFYCGFIKPYRKHILAQTEVSFWQKLKHSMWLMVESQWKIFVALFPLMVIFFKQVTWISPLSNLFAIPWLGAVVVPLDIIGGALSYISDTFGAFGFFISMICVWKYCMCFSMA